MGPRRCNIEGCKSVAGRQQHRGVTFHTFPTNATIRQNWMTNCRFPSTKSITKSVLICSRHFRRVDFQPLKNNKYLLKPGSEPTIFPWTQSAAASTTSASSAATTAVLASTSSNSSTAEASSSNDAKATSTSSIDVRDTVGGEIEAKPMTPEERIVNQILSDAIKSDMKSPMKRSASADVGSGGGGQAEPKTKQLRKSLDSAMFKKTADASAAAAAAASGSDPDSLFRPGAEIEAQDFKEVWHPAEVMEVDQVDREVLIHFDTANIKIIDEWIPMNSSRLRARQLSASPAISSTSAPPSLSMSVDDLPPLAEEAVDAIVVVVPQPTSPQAVAQAAVASTAAVQPLPLPGNLPVLKKAPYNYIVGEKCMAKWTDSRRWRATVQTVLDLDYYDVLFDDGYTKRCHAKDMSKIKRQPPQHGSSGPPPNPLFTATTSQQLQPPAPLHQQTQAIASPVVVASAAPTTSTTPAAAPKPATGGGRKINPPLPIPKFDLASLNLLPVPKDGEWCCNWVNDTPIGAEGYLEGPDGNRRPTVLVEDWRLPAGWTKHLYQRSSVSGKWDVVLVGPTKKRFRSKNDVKVFLDEHGLQYNPDVYDFSIHKRRAKDLGLFVFTEDYKEAQHLKQQQLLQRLADQKHTALAPASSFDALNQSNVSNISTEEVFQGFPAPVTPMSPPHPGASSMSFHSFAAPSMTTTQPSSSSSGLIVAPIAATSAVVDKPPSPLDEGYVYVGSLKVQMHDNLFRCPEPTCCKNFRKENHLQIHVKHYHDHLSKQMGECLNMAELAYIRTTGELPPPEETIVQSHKPAMNVDAMSADTIEAGGALTGGAIAGSVDDLHDDFQLDGNRTSTPVKPATIAGQQEPSAAHNHSAPAAIGGPRQPYPKKYKKAAKNVKSRLKLKLQKQHGNRYTKSGRSIRPLTASLSERYTDYDMNDDGEYQDSDYVPEGGSGTAAGPSAASSASPAVRSNRLKFLNHPQVLADAVAAGADPNAALLLSPPPVLPPQTDVYVDENGEVIKLVRMRQEEIINCLCLYSEEDGLMIQCELCLTWQHGRCHGFEKESAVPDKYVCYICQNPQSGRPSMRFVHDQEWLYEGRLPVTEQQPQQQRPAVHDADTSGGALEVVLPKHRERFDMLKHSHTLTGNLVELKRFMHSLQVKINIAENKDHPKMYLWARKWEKGSPQSRNHNDVLSGIVPLSGAQNDAKNHVVKLESGGGGDAPTIEEVQVINDLMSNADAMKHIERAAAEIAKTEIKNEAQTKQVKQEDEVDGNILAGLLTSPGGTNIDLVGAVDKQAQHGNRRSIGGTPMGGAPQPEAAIDPVECQLRLLDHIQKQQMQAMTRLQSIEAEVIGLEAMDEHAEPVDANDSFGTTKRQIFQLISDLTKIRKLAAINLAEDDEQQLKSAAAVPSTSTPQQATIG